MKRIGKFLVRLGKYLIYMSVFSLGMFIIGFMLMNVGSDPSIGIIGGADGPTAIFITGIIGSKLKFPLFCLFIGVCSLIGGKKLIKAAEDEEDDGTGQY